MEQSAGVGLSEGRGAGGEQRSSSPAGPGSGLLSDTVNFSCARRSEFSIRSGWRTSAAGAKAFSRAEGPESWDSNEDVLGS